MYLNLERKVSEEIILCILSDALNHLTYISFKFGANPAISGDGLTVEYIDHGIYLYFIYQRRKDENGCSFRRNLSSKHETDEILAAFFSAFKRL